MRTRAFVSIIVAFVCLIGSPVSSGGSGALAQQPGELPILKVTRISPPDDAVMGLIDKMRLAGNPLDENGVLQYVDPERLHLLPVMEIGEGEPTEDQEPVLLEAIDFKALEEWPVTAPEEALKIVEETFSELGLLTFGDDAIGVNPMVGQTMFEAYAVDGEPLTSVALDTVVYFDFAFKDIPIVGPGAKVKLAFDGEGVTTQMMYAFRSVEPSDIVPVIPVDEAENACWNAYTMGGKNTPEGLKVSAELVYYAPPFAVNTVSMLLPHYRCRGEFETEAGVNGLPETFIPAVDPGTGLVPQVELTAKTDGESVSAEAHISGGTPPYAYFWGSSSTTLDPAIAEGVLEGEMATIDYMLSPRDAETVTEETVSFVIVDAEGISAQASFTTPLGGAAQPVSEPITLVGYAPKGEPVDWLVPGSIDAGAEWLGNCAGLPNTPQNGQGFVNRFEQEGIPVQFRWGEQNAWERDFKDETLVASGIDHDYVDNVDIVFFNGHGNGSGFTFCSSQDDQFLNNTEARWGNLDLEWLAVDACEVLSLGSGNNRWYNRWGPAFDGLHLFLSYATINYNTTREGPLFAEYMLRTPFLWWNHPMKVREAWAQMATDVHGSDVEWAVMGVIGQGGMVNYNDYFHGKGSVGPDIRAEDITGYWLLHGPS